MFHHGKVIKFPMRVLTESLYQHAETCLKGPSPCNPEELPGLYFDTAEYYKDRGRQFRINALSLEKAIIAAIQAQMSAQASRLRKEREQIGRVAEKSLQAAVEFYIAVLELPQTARRDKALLGLGVVYVLMNKPNLAVEQYQHLIRDLPKSSFIPDAYLALGEIRFAEGDWMGADKFYASVLKLPPSRAVPCALYKQAWTDYRRGFRALARKSFSTCRKIPADLLGNQNFTDQLTSACTADAKRLGLPSE
jgi:TolA-binding protein